MPLPDLNSQRGKYLIGRYFEGENDCLIISQTRGRENFAQVFDQPMAYLLAALFITVYDNPKVVFKDPNLEELYSVALSTEEIAFLDQIDPDVLVRVTIINFRGLDLRRLV